MFSMKNYKVISWIQCLQLEKLIAEILGMLSTTTIWL